MGNIIGSVILGLVAVICFIISFLQFTKKGVLFNNAYLYASKQEKENMNKNPYYKQSGMVFLFLGIIFLIDAVNIILQTKWLFYIIVGIVVFLIIYAIISSIRIDKRG